MGEEHPDARVVREGYEAFERGDAEWMNEHMADDVVWHVGGKSKWSGAYTGKDQVLALFGRQTQAFGAPPEIEVHDVVANDEHAIAIGSASVQDPQGGRVEWRWANVFHIEDGKAKEVWGLAEDSSGIDELVNRLPD